MNIKKGRSGITCDVIIDITTLTCYNKEVSSVGM